MTAMSSMDGVDEKVDAPRVVLPTTNTQPGELESHLKARDRGWSSAPNRAASSKGGALIALISLVSVVCWHGWMQQIVSSTWTILWSSSLSRAVYNAEICPQASPLVPSVHGQLWKEINDVYASEEFESQAVDWLGSAVRVPTEVYDKMDPPGTDPRWEKFYAFHQYLRDAFPKVHAAFNLTKVNKIGLLYHWQGSDDTLKPLLLAAHQDVVPVNEESVDEWVHPPFSGHFDGQRLWGRGSGDDKSGLIGIMSSLETLLEHEFTPKRSIVLAFGFDEERGGVYGARSLGEAMLLLYGEEAFAMIVDEGGGYGTQYGGVFASPGIAEKGKLDTRIEVSTPGGHSSIPPEHTSIGILASLLVHMEANPDPPKLDRTAPFYGTIQCFGKFGPSLPQKLRNQIQESLHSDDALKAVEAAIFPTEKSFRALASTTQAIDLIGGGVKTNALPESAWAVVNHRISTQSSVSAIKERDTALFAELAQQFGLSYQAFGKNVSVKGTAGSLLLEDAFGTSLEPAPVTPTTAISDPFMLLSGTIRSVYAISRAGVSNQGAAKDIFIAPGHSTGNTDTRSYWKLSKHIFRYNHHDRDDAGDVPGGAHTVNESIGIKSFIGMIQFFTTLILNVDESSKL